MAFVATRWAWRRRRTERTSGSGLSKLWKVARCGGGAAARVCSSRRLLNAGFVPRGTEAARRWWAKWFATMHGASLGLLLNIWCGSMVGNERRTREGDYGVKERMWERRRKTFHFCFIKCSSWLMRFFFFFFSSAKFWLMSLNKKKSSSPNLRGYWESC